MPEEKQRFTSMKLSQPRSARSINTCRVLNLIRSEKGLSKAGLSRKLGLNKVSVGEIVDRLVSQGIVKEAGKLESSNGRRPMSLELSKDSRFALGVDIGPKTSMIALSGLDGEIIRFERIPTICNKSAEDFCVGMIKSLMRTMKLVPHEAVLGVGITLNARMSEDRRAVERCSFLPWGSLPLAEALEKSLGIKAALCNSLEALVRAERFSPEGGKRILYVDWGERINAAMVRDRKVFSLHEGFGHLKVSPSGLCNCSQIGCLEAVASTWALAKAPDASLKDIWGQPDLAPAIDAAIEAMANALGLASRACGFDLVVVGGQGSTIPDEELSRLASMFDDVRHPYSPHAVIMRSALGERANIAAALNFALDEFFFQSSFLSGVERML